MKILITGASSGIGRSIVEKLKDLHDITVLDMNYVQCPKIKFKKIDLFSTQEVQNFLSSSEAHFDALINAAGIREIITPHELTIDEWERIQKINVTAPFILSKYLIQKSLFNQKKLSIVNIASVSGLLGEPNRVAYVTSKHALIGMTKQLAFQYGRHGIRVNAIAPGIIETPLTASYFSDPHMIELINAGTPVGRWGQPEHLHSLVDICLSNEFMNGSVLVCDGGWSCGKSL